MDEATRNQVEAAHPGVSTWLSANAGSGKTKVLTDRVARLLLRGTPPQRILCLTYTKAAASEMQNRLFRRLGEWAMLPNEQLVGALRELGEDVDGDRDILIRARRLFARAIEAPGGLKIQTIHAFCSSVLRRFPLEAAVSPDFAEVEERSLQQLRNELLDQLAEGPSAPLLADLLARLSEDAFGKLLQDLGKYRDGFLTRPSNLHTLFGLPEGLDEERLLGLAFDADEKDLFQRLIPKLRGGGPKDNTFADRLGKIGATTLADIAALEVALFTKTGANAFLARPGKYVTKDTSKTIGADDLAALDELGERIEAARPLRLGLASMQATEVLHRFARLWLPAFDAAKLARGWLDFDDLIRLTRQLLGVSSVAQWVLFKLDGGIDHILVDEAQDTSPEQWRVIDLLTQEFAAGQSARQDLRTIFVVGDRKQSIYSFQGADLRGFETTREAFHQRLTDAGQGLALSELKHSFRSSNAILRLVDHCFAPVHGQSGLGGAAEHLAFHQHMPGRVDLWPSVPKPAKTDDLPWDSPLDRPSQSHEDIVLARNIAQEMRAMIDRGEQIDTGNGLRRVHEGDFLILVRRRGVLFDALIRSCKAEGLEIAGADRMVLGEELAVHDLISLLKFLALPEDDLSLAVALRSPMFGWSEDRLFRLAHARGDRFLWEAMRADPSTEDTRAILDDLRGQVDFLRPYELIERALTRHDGRRRIRARFGAEVDEALEAFVDLALSYEQGHLPSLDGFLGWLEASDAEVKRQSESAGKRVRVMTVHGAKGLEAPIVILPDTAARRAPNGPSISEVGGIPIVRALKADATEAQTEADSAALFLRDEESDRLLYVALTRAESWLIVSGAGAADNNASWYSRVSKGMEDLPVTPIETALGTGLRYEHGQWPTPAGSAGKTEQTIAPTLVLAPLPAVKAAPQLVSPSALGGAKALAGEGADTETALARGSMIHNLLEHLPGIDDANRERRGHELLAGSAHSELAADCVSEALRVLRTPELSFMMGRDALVEVAVSGRWQERMMWGLIDRLLIDDSRVLAIDFKSNRIVPTHASGVPEGLLRQMGGYAHLLAGIYPDKRVETALLWTAEARLMPLQQEAVSAALARAALDPAPAPS